MMHGPIKLDSVNI